MNYYFISDTHFYHDNIVKYCNRPEDHMKIMVKNWNKVVTDNDIVFHLGDVAFKTTEKETELQKLFKLLKGKKHLIKGNHDTRNDDFYKSLGFLTIENYYMDLRIDNKKIMCCHYPLVITPHTNETQKEVITQLIDEYKSLKFTHVIHGHVHNSLKLPYKNHYNVSVENIDYTPISIESILRNFDGY